MDGAGVKIKRHSLVDSSLADSYILLDEICSDDADDFIADSLSHPHSGIETFTYMGNVGIHYQDHMGKKGEVLSSSDQWMRASRGVIHGEIPLKEHDSMHCFQLWIILSKTNEMTDPEYRDVPKKEIPTLKQMVI
jgi:redox-sensitive bicupin YhaK (pirin superfamily)